MVGVPDRSGRKLVSQCAVFAEGGTDECPALGEWLDGKIARYKLQSDTNSGRIAKSGYGKVAKGLIRNRLLVDSAALPPSSGGIRDGGVPKP